MSALIRQATLEDIAVVTRLQQEFIQDHADLYDLTFYEMKDGADKEWSRWAEGKFKSGELGLFVAEKNVVVGYVSGWVETRPPIYVLNKIGYLSNIYVVPKHRRQGIGAALNSALLDWFRKQGLEHVELTVDSRAKESVNSWVGMGYEEVGKRMRVNL